MHEAEMILVAVGANLPGPFGANPAAACRRAVEVMAGLDGLRLVAVSRWYRTVAVPRSAQPDYVNGVVRFEGSTDPAALLAALQAIEHEAGRVRGARNAARTLDLDIIDIGGQCRAAPDPVLPHPRAAERAFVLVPLADVAPNWIEPGRGRTVGALLAAMLAPLGDAGCGATPKPLD